MYIEFNKNYVYVRDKQTTRRDCGCSCRHNGNGRWRGEREGATATESGRGERESAARRMCVILWIFLFHRRQSHSVTLLIVAFVRSLLFAQSADPRSRREAGDRNANDCPIDNFVHIMKLIKYLHLICAQTIRFFVFLSVSRVRARFRRRLLRSVDCRCVMAAQARTYGGAATPARTRRRSGNEERAERNDR